MTINVWPSGVATSENNLLLSYEKVGDTRYPKVPVIIHEDGDPRIQKLFARYSTEAHLVDDVKFKLDAIEVFRDIYGAFPRFIAYQFDYNYLMHGLNLEFLEDTLRYIMTGRRNFSLL